MRVTWCLFLASRALKRNGIGKHVHIVLNVNEIENHTVTSHSKTTILFGSLELKWFENESRACLVNLSCMPALLNSSCLHKSSHLTDLSNSTSYMHVCFINSSSYIYLSFIT